MPPLISVKIPTYNCAIYLKDTILSILEQKDFDLNLLDIEVVDDFSTNDNPEEIVKEYGQGVVKFYRQPQNIGAVKNFNSCIERSETEFIHILHGDDFIENNFYSEMYKEILYNNNLGIYSSRCNFVDERSKIIGDSIIIKDFNINNFLYQTPIQFSSIIINSRIAKNLGGFDENLIHLNDRDMWLRIVTHSGWKHSNLVLSNYRIFEGNDSSKLIKSGENIHDTDRYYKKNKRILGVSQFTIDTILYNLFKNQIKNLSVVDLNKNKAVILSILGRKYYFFKIKDVLLWIKNKLILKNNQ